ncbi:MAG TPA: DUF6348 family protein [Nonomuraea sp.]|nr:DUF6348 family protein [Nonomuraea sp.]
MADEAVLGMLAERLSALTGRPWRVRQGRVEGPWAAAVTSRGDHAGRPGHLDLDVVLTAGVIGDCVTGYGATPEEAVARAVHIWLDTTAAAVLELLVGDGSHAAHFASDDPDGFPGRHAVHGGITGWGVGDHHDAVQRWAVRHALLPHLAPELKGTIGRDPLVGVRAFFGGGAGRETAEVRVAGVRHETASRALAGLDWPRPATGLSYARTFILLADLDPG